MFDDLTRRTFGQGQQWLVGTSTVGATCRTGVAASRVRDARRSSYRICACAANPRQGPLGGSPVCTEVTTSWIALVTAAV